MICPKCQKEFLSADKFCPYCGEQIKAEETVEETIEETVEETVEETEVAEEVETEEVEETEEDLAEAAAILAEAQKAEKKSNAAVKVLAVLVVIAAVVAAFFLGGKLLGENGGAEDTTAADTTAGVTDAVDAELFPEDYVTAHPDGFDYFAADLDSYITLGEYKGLTVEYTESEVTDTEVEEYISQILANYSETEDITDRAAQTGDTVVVDYSGSLEGVAFDGGTAENQTVTIGAGGYIDGFEDGLIGMQIGETKVVDCTFPVPYPNNPDLAGKVAQFEFTLHSISTSVVPECTDEFVKEQFGFDTVADFKADVRAYLESENQAAIDSEKQSNLLDAITANVTVKGYPDGLVEDAMFSQIDYLKQYADMYGATYEDFIMQGTGMGASEYEAVLREEAKEYVTLEMTLFAIAKAEGLGTTDEEISAATSEYLTEAQQTDVATLCAQMGVTEKFFANYIKYTVVVEKVFEFLMENTTFNVVK